MGQYWQIYNETKKQKMNPWDFGEVAKLYEWPQDGPGGMQSALVILLLEPSSLGDGGGDYDFDSAPAELRELIGSWRGDAVSIVGDYSHLARFGAIGPDEEYPKESWDHDWTDISKQMVELMSYESYMGPRGICGNAVSPDHEWIGYQYKGFGADKVKTTLADVHAGGQVSRDISLAPDMVIEKNGEA